MKGQEFPGQANKHEDTKKGPGLPDLLLDRLNFPSVLGAVPLTIDFDLTVSVAITAATGGSPGGLRALHAHTTSKNLLAVKLL